MIDSAGGEKNLPSGPKLGHSWLVPLKGEEKREEEREVVGGRNLEERK